jgi:hypothetical protein
MLWQRSVYCLEAVQSPCSFSFSTSPHVIIFSRCLMVNNYLVFIVDQWTWMRFHQSAVSASPVESAWRMNWEVRALALMRASLPWTPAYTVRARLWHSSQSPHHPLGQIGE